MWVFKKPRKTRKALMHIVVLGGDNKIAMAYKSIFNNNFVYADWTVTKNVSYVTRSLGDLADIFRQLSLADIVIRHYGSMKDYHWPDPKEKAFLKTRFESLEAYASEFEQPYTYLSWQVFQYDHNGNPVGFMKEETVQMIAELVGKKL